MVVVVLFLNDIDMTKETSCISSDSIRSERGNDCLQGLKFQFQVKRGHRPGDCQIFHSPAIEARSAALYMIPVASQPPAGYLQPPSPGAASSEAVPCRWRRQICSAHDQLLSIWHGGLQAEFRSSKIWKIGGKKRQ